MEESRNNLLTEKEKLVQGMGMLDYNIKKLNDQIDWLKKENTGLQAEFLKMEASHDHANKMYQQKQLELEAFEKS